MFPFLEGRISCRQTAPFHVQLKLEKSSARFSVPSKLRVEGRVVRVFRSDGRLALGDHVAFLLWVCRPGDEPTGPAYVYHDDFIPATYMEVYLHGSPPKCELAGHEFTILEGPSEEPAMNVAQLEELLLRWKAELRSEREALEAHSSRTSNAKSWWQFWKA